MPLPESLPACPPDRELVELVEGRLAGSAAARLSEHVAGCSACGAFFAVLSTGERAAGGTTATTARIARAVLEGRGAPATGEILGRGASIGRYLILSLLGRGGMGEVYAAYDPELDRRVAVKLLHTARGAEGARRRLTREARALGKLSHPNVVQVHDVGEHEGDVFVAMELVDGPSLDAFCEGPPQPSWEEVLAAYLDAARGLAAAHEKGIVHRDVKPSNLLRGKDGRVRVADFGLAAARADDASPGREAGDASADAPDAAPGRAAGGDVTPLEETIPALSDSDDDAQLTATGAILGTPLYMAPEQYEGLVSAASDQHSLCTALYQGLYGVLPFELQPGARLFAILTRKNAGPPPAPPAGTLVPPRIFRALARGLAPRPEDRFPSMDALAAALRAEPDARRGSGWRAAAVGAAAVIAVAAAGVRSGVFNDPCEHPERQLAGAWDDDVKGRVRIALLDTGRGYAGDTAARVTALLDRYAASWASMRGEVCEASRGTQRHEILGLRDGCLDRRRDQLKALTTLLAEKPDTEVLDRAVEATGALHPVAYCADTEALTARVPPPEDPALRAQAAALQPRLDRLIALTEAGKYQDARALGERLLTEAEALEHPALQAQVAYWVGRARAVAGDFEGAKAALREASLSAAQGNDDLLAAEAWVRLLLILGESQQRFDEAAVIRAMGLAVVARAHDHRVMASWLRAEGDLLLRLGKYPEARQNQEHAISLLEQILPPDHLDIADTRSDLARVLQRMGDLPQALAANERALQVRERALGPDHPEVGETLDHIGTVLVAMGEFPRAVATYERALAVKEKAMGPDHLRVGITLGNLGSVLARMHDLPRAQALQERALVITEKALGPDHPDLAKMIINLGTTRSNRGDNLGAKALYERAAVIEEKALGPDHPDLAKLLVDLGGVLAALDDWAGAARLLERGVAVTEKALGPDHPTLVPALTELGRVQVHLGQLDAALAVFERARAMSERLPGLSAMRKSPPLVGLGELYLARHDPARAAAMFELALGLGAMDTRNEVLLELADALWQLGKDRPRARALGEESRAAYAHDGDQGGVDDAVKWLVTHPMGGR
jgi:eukaryotic-like serine/threonine-protein kinase